MKRSTFLLITAVLGGIFGSMMLFVPEKAAEGFGIASGPVVNMFFHLVGGMVLSAGILNFLVRSHVDSPTLKAILIFNIVFHALGMITDCMANAGGVIEFGKIVPGYMVHLFVGIGSAIYLMKMKSTA